MGGDTRFTLAIIGVGLGLAGLILQQMSGFGGRITVACVDMGILRDGIQMVCSSTDHATMSCKARGGLNLTDCRDHIFKGSSSDDRLAKL